MAGTLIMPKQTGQKDAFYASLQLYYESYKHGEEWYSNVNFKTRIQELLPYLSRGAQDGPYLVKQSELTRYFGLVYLIILPARGEPKSLILELDSIMLIFKMIKRHKLILL